MTTAPTAPRRGGDGDSGGGDGDGAVARRARRALARGRGRRGRRGRRRSVSAGAACTQTIMCAFLRQPLHDELSLRKCDHANERCCKCKFCLHLFCNQNTGPVCRNIFYTDGFADLVSFVRTVQLHVISRGPTQIVQNAERDMTSCIGFPFFPGFLILDVQLHLIFKV